MLRGLFSRGRDAEDIGKGKGEEIEVEYSRKGIDAMERGKDKKGKTGGETFPGSEGAPGSQSDYVYGGQEYYYQPHLSHLQYSYDMMDASQWAAHTHGIQQHHHLGYPPLYG